MNLSLCIYILSLYIYIYTHGYRVGQGVPSSDSNQYPNTGTRSSITLLFHSLLASFFAISIFHLGPRMKTKPNHSSFTYSQFPSEFCNHVMDYCFAVVIEGRNVIVNTILHIQSHHQTICNRSINPWMHGCWYQNMFYGSIISSNRLSSLQASLHSSCQKVVSDSHLLV